LLLEKVEKRICPECTAQRTTQAREGDEENSEVRGTTYRGKKKRVHKGNTGLKKGCCVGSQSGGVWEKIKIVMAGGGKMSTKRRGVLNKLLEKGKKLGGVSAQDSQRHLKRAKRNVRWAALFE